MSGEFDAGNLKFTVNGVDNAAPAEAALDRLEKKSQQTAASVRAANNNLGAGTSVGLADLRSELADNDSILGRMALQSQITKTQVGMLRTEMGMATTGFQRGAVQAEIWNTQIAGGRAQLAPYLQLASSVAPVVLGVAAAVGGAAYAMKRLSDETVRSHDAIGDMHEVTGIAVEDLAGMRLLADETEQSIDSLGQTFKFLARATVDADNGTGEAAAAFKKLGIDTREANGNMKPALDIFKEVADKLKTVATVQERATIEMTLFGRSGTEMAEIMALGGDEIERVIEQGKQFAPVTEANTAAAQRAIVANAELKASWVGLKEELGTGLTPAVTGATNILTNWVVFAKGIWNEAFPEPSEYAGRNNAWLADMGATMNDAVHASEVWKARMNDVDASESSRKYAEARYREWLAEVLRLANKINEVNASIQSRNIAAAGGYEATLGLTANEQFVASQPAKNEAAAEQWKKDHPARTGSGSVRRQPAAPAKEQVWDDYYSRADRSGELATPYDGYEMGGAERNQTAAAGSSAAYQAEQDEADKYLQDRLTWQDQEYRAIQDHQERLRELQENGLASDQQIHDLQVALAYDKARAYTSAISTIAGALDKSGRASAAVQIPLTIADISREVFDAARSAASQDYLGAVMHTAAAFKGEQALEALMKAAGGGGGKSGGRGGGGGGGGGHKDLSTRQEERFTQSQLIKVEGIEGIDREKFYSGEQLIGLVKNLKTGFKEGSLANPFTSN